MTGMPGLRYVKGHGTANDFVLLPDPDDELDLSPALVRALCDRRRGLGGDGVLRVVSADLLHTELPAGTGDDPEARWFMDYHNADGSVAEMCGNGIRVFARYLVEAGFAQPGTLRIATRDGVKTVELSGDGDVTVDMGAVRLLEVDGCAVTTGGRTLPGVAVSVGNPHVVVRVEDPGEVGALTAPPEVTPPEAFPAGTNVEFVATPGAGRLLVRVHERGVGETFSCGTGACAAAAAVHAADRPGNGERAPASYAVTLPGGELGVTLCADGRALLTGPAVLVAQGVLRDEWLDAINAGTNWSGAGVEGER